MSHPIVITTPTGNIGSKIVSLLQAQGETVRVIARHPENLAQHVRDTVTVHSGDLFDEPFMTRATEGAAALFLLTPPMWDAPDVQAVYEQAARIAGNIVRKNRIPSVVHLSSAGAHRDGAGPISLIRQVESALDDTEANVVHLRPGFFFENFTSQVDAIRNAGAIFMPMPAESSLPMVATADIAQVATGLLRDQDFVGKTYRGIHGPTDLTFAQAVAEIGAGIGREVRYQEMRPGEAHAMFLQLGASPDFARLYIEMFAALATYGQHEAEPRTAETTTPTTLCEWAAATLKPLLS